MGPKSWWLRFLNHHPITSPPTNQKRVKHPAALPVNLPETQLRSLGILSMSYWFSSLGPWSRPSSALSVLQCSSLLVTVCGAVNLGLATQSYCFKGNWLLSRKWNLGACPSYPSLWRQDMPSGASSLQREASQEWFESRALAQVSLSLPRSAFSEQSLSWLTPLYKAFFSSVIIPFLTSSLLNWKPIFE